MTQPAAGERKAETVSFAATGCRLRAGLLLCGFALSCVCLAVQPAAAQDSPLSAFQPYFNSFGTSEDLGTERSFGFTAGTADEVLDETPSDDGFSFGFRDSRTLGLGYNTAFSGVGLEARLHGSLAGTADDTEGEAYGIGGALSLDVLGLTMSAGAVWDDLDGAGGTGWATDLGLAYGSGPWLFSLSGIYVREDDSGDELLGSAANVSYSLATGVSLFAIGYLGDEDLGAAGSNEILAISSGIKLSF
jgi:hypothetical protein